MAKQWEEGGREGPLRTSGGACVGEYNISSLAEPRAAPLRRPQERDPELDLEVTTGSPLPSTEPSAVLMGPEECDGVSGGRGARGSETGPDGRPGRVPLGLRHTATQGVSLGAGSHIPRRACWYAHISSCNISKSEFLHSS